jgi:hypothetical protein
MPMLAFAAERLLYSTWFCGATSMPFEKWSIASSKLPALNAALPLTCHTYVSISDTALCATWAVRMHTTKLAYQRWSCKRFR